MLLLYVNKSYWLCIHLIFISLLFGNFKGTFYDQDILKMTSVTCMVVDLTTFYVTF